MPAAVAGLRHGGTFSGAARANPAPRRSGLKPISNVPHQRSAAPAERSRATVSQPQSAPARESRCAAALPALVLPLDPLSEATPPNKRYPQGENPSAARTRTGEGAATHGPRVVLVTWPGAVKALSRPANPGRRSGRIPDSTRLRARPRGLGLRGAGVAALLSSWRVGTRKVRAGENPGPL